MSPRRISTVAPRWAVAIAILALLGLLGACTSAGAKDNPTWRPQTTPTPAPLPTQVLPDPGGGGEGGGTASPPNSGSPPSGGSSSSAVDPNVVATKLAAPTGIAILPDGSALVGERSTGRIVVVQATAGQPVTAFKQLDGLNFTNGGGLLDIALSATYAEDGIILALVSTGTDIRVVHFTRTGPVTTILTGIPFGTSANTGRLLVLDNGDVLVGTGSAGQNAADPASLGGKILRVDDLGRPLADNPNPSSPVYASGFTTVNGLCSDPATAAIYATTQAGGNDTIRVVTAGSSSAATASTLPGSIGGVGGCGVVESNLYVSGLGGKDCFEAPFTGKSSFGTFTGLLKGKYGRINNLVTAADGSVWLTTSNRDGQGSPVTDDERVIHIHPDSSGGGSTL